MEVSYRLHVAGERPSRAATLPELPGSTSYEPNVLDAYGEGIQRFWPVVGAGALAGAATGIALIRGGGGARLGSAATTSTLFGGLKHAFAGVAGAVAGSVGVGIVFATRHDASPHRVPAAAGAGPVASPTVAADEDLRVMTYNLHGGMGGPGKYLATDAKLDALADVIDRERPDVLILQEVDRFASRSGYSDVLDELAERLDPDSAVAAPAATFATGREQHVAIMTFNGAEITDARNVVHPDSRGGSALVRTRAVLRDIKTGIGALLRQDWNGGARYEVRNTLDAMVRTPAGNAVRVLGGHYDAPRPELDHQSRQVAGVAGALDAWDGPTIWGADFNVGAISPRMTSEQAIMGEAGLRDAFEAVPDDERLPSGERSTNPRFPGRALSAIDRIYVSEQLDVASTWVGHEAGAASDHLPVVTDVTLHASTS